MLQTAKLLARRGGNSVDSNQVNGLTFGQFCVLAADLKRFRTSFMPFMDCSNTNDAAANAANDEIASTSREETEMRTNHDTATNMNDSNAPEVFLGGSCNPTTWRADVAIPTLKQLGISFYNPVCDEYFLFSFNLY